MRRLVYAVLVFITSLIVVPFTLAQVLNDEIAVRVWPFASRAKANVASDILNARINDVAARERAKGLATAALRLSPINTVAARSLGLAKAAAGDEESAAQAFDYALQLSRRDVPTHLWFIERAVQQDDIAGALHHYDQAMRTSTSSRDLLIPILVGASQDPNVAAILVPMLRRKPSWWGAFVHLLIGTAADPYVPYRIVRGLNLRSDDPEHPDFLPRTIERLVTAGKYDAAFDLYEHAAGADSGLLRNGGFEQADPLPPLDWSYAQDLDLGASRQMRLDGKGTALFLTAQSGRGGPVAHQILQLSPGNYRITLTAGELKGAVETERPKIVLRCASANADPLLETVLPVSPSSGRQISANFMVPESCRSQRLMIEARSSFTGSSEAVPWIDDITIRSNNG